MTFLCEICHKEEATGTIWLDAEQSPIHVGGVYRIGDNCMGKQTKKKERPPNYDIPE